jgi:hypothetical protein
MSCRYIELIFEAMELGMHGVPILGTRQFKGTVDCTFTKIPLETSEAATEMAVQLNVRLRMSLKEFQPEAYELHVGGSPCREVDGGNVSLRHMPDPNTQDGREAATDAALVR